MLLDLAQAKRVAGGLFDRPDSAASVARMRAIDQLNQKMSTVKVTLQNPPTGGPAPAPAKK